MTLISLADFATPFKPHCYLDTIELFVHSLNEAQWRAIRALCQVKPVVNRHNGYIAGSRLIFNQTLHAPTKARLQRLQQLLGDTKYSIVGVDVAADINDLGAKEVIRQTAVLKWARTPLQDHNGTIYFSGLKRRGTMLVVYNDKPDRFTAMPCTHIELRLRGSACLKRNGIVCLDDILALNPRQLFARRLKFSDIGLKYAAEVMKRTLAAERKQFIAMKPRRSSPRLEAFSDWYRSQLHPKVTGMLRMLGSDTAQRVTKIQRYQRHRCLEVLDLPTELDLDMEAEKWPLINKGNLERLEGGVIDSSGKFRGVYGNVELSLIRSHSSSQEAAPTFDISSNIDPDEAAIQRPPLRRRQRSTQATEEP